MTLSLPISYSESVEPALVMVPLEPRVVVAVCVEVSVSVEVVVRVEEPEPV